jgi:hypothetical protein
MRRDAAWLLRRYRDRAAPDWRVKQVLERELNRVVEGHAAVRSEMEELRRSAPSRLRAFDAASDKALQYMGERRFDLALKEIRKAERELVELRRLIRVAVELDRVSTAIEEIESLLGSSFTSLTTPRVLRHVRALARELLNQGEPRKASFVVLLLRSQVDRLRSRDHRELFGLMTMLEELTAKGGTAGVEMLRKLTGEGYLYLAQRLAEDLDSELDVEDRSRRGIETPGGALGPLTEELTQIRLHADSTGRCLATWLQGSGPAGSV